MSEINTNVVLDGITLALRTAYPNRKIESNKIMQGLKCPAFIVRLVSASQSARSGIRWIRRPRFDILYFPVRERESEECYKVADELCEILETITLPGGDKLRGTNMEFEIVDGVLHFFISYSHFVLRVPVNEGSMNGLDLQQGGFGDGKRDKKR